MSLVPKGIRGMDKLLGQLHAYPRFVRDQQRQLLHKHARSLISSTGSTPGLIQLTPPHSKGKRGNAAKEPDPSFG